MSELFGRSAHICLYFLAVFLIAPVHAGATGQLQGQSQPKYEYQKPESVRAGWEVALLEDVGVRKDQITHLMRDILEEKFKNIHSVLLVRNGKLVLEEYFHGNNRETLHEIRSATKSIGSVLTGIAIDRGFIDSANETIYPYFKSYEPAGKWDAKVRDVTLKSLLTMTSGYACNDHGSKKFQCERNMYKADDWVAYAVNLPMAHQPGEHWAYNSASLWLVGEIISKTSGMTIPEFADKYLFEPMGIQEFKWGFSPKGRAWLAGNAKMRPRDMAKFGYMLLNDGRWKQNQIVSKKWIAESTREYVRAHGGAYGYGFLWWRGQTIVENQIIETIAALGNGGQQIHIFPKLKLVAVFTGGNYNSDFSAQPADMLIKYIIPAVLRPAPNIKAAEMDPNILKKYVGSYYFDRMKLTATIFIENRQLKYQTSSQDREETIVLIPESEAQFRGSANDVGDFQLTFNTNEKDKVTHFHVCGGFGFSRLKFEKINE